jgi:transcriptional regulator with XRE-family HTH domain
MPDLTAFLSDLRALREARGLSIDELAALTHYPVETLAAAESGPARPDLPVVEAYVRACGGDPGPWEDRWRALHDEPDYGWFAPAPRSFTRPALAAAATLVVIAAAAGAVVVLRPASRPTAVSHSNVTTSTRPSPPPQTPSLRSVPSSRPSVTAQPSATRPSATQPSATRPSATQPIATHSAAAQPSPAGAVTQVTGVGCPQGTGDGVTLDNAASGPGWTQSASGGWTENGCDGDSVSTTDHSGAAASTLTWFFAPGSARTCTLAVFIPTQNAVGAADYAVESGTTDLGTVTVEQSSLAGQWVTLGGYTVSGSPVDIRLSPDPSATLTTDTHGHGRGDTIAASAARAICGLPPVNSSPRSPIQARPSP